MSHTYKFSLILLSTTMFLGCSEKSFTLQSYADKYFNNPSAKEENTKSIQTETVPEVANETDKTLSAVSEPNSSFIDDKKTNPNIKSGPGADIAWSSTYKQDEKTQGQGSLQKSLNEWFTTEWFPSFEGDEEQAKEDEAANEHFTLQHYVDKATKYMKRKEAANAGKPKEPANYEKLNEMPVIGK